MTILMTVAGHDRVASGRLRATRRPDPATGTLPWDITPREVRRFAAIERRPGRPAR